MPHTHGDIVLANDSVQVRNLSGSLGGGVLIGQVAYHLREPERSTFNLMLQSAEAGQLLAVWPGLTEGTRGPIDIVVRGSLGRRWRGVADVSFHRGTILGIDVSLGSRLLLNHIFDRRLGSMTIKV